MKCKIINMFAYVFNAEPFMTRPSAEGLTSFIVENAQESTPPIGRGRIMRRNGALRDISLSQGNGRAARRIIQSSPGFILQTATGLIDYLITCVRESPEWPGLLRGK